MFKLDAWAVFALPLIRHAFPDAPCVFLYRDPVEVVVSHLRTRGYHMVAGTLPPEWLGLPAEVLYGLSPEEYCAVVVAAIGRTALAAARRGQLLPVPYRALPGAATDVVAPAFGIDIADGDRAVLEQAATRDAKNPGHTFHADSARKQDKASALVRAAVAAHCGSLVNELDELWDGVR